MVIICKWSVCVCIYMHYGARVMRAVCVCGNANPLLEEKRGNHREEIGSLCVGDVAGKKRIVCRYVGWATMTRFCIHVVD